MNRKIRNDNTFLTNLFTEFIIIVSFVLFEVYRIFMLLEDGNRDSGSDSSRFDRSSTGWSEVSLRRSVGLR